MALSYELISQFAKLATSNTKNNNGTTVYGYVGSDEDNNKYVIPDGSNQKIPIDSTGATVTSVENGNRVSVLIKDHTAIVTGNISSPSATSGDIIAVLDTVQSREAYIKNLIADEVTLGKLKAEEVTIAALIGKTAEIDDLITEKATITDLIAKKIDANVVITDYAKIKDLETTRADIDELVTGKLEAKDAEIDRLYAKTTDIENLYAKKAEITNLDSKFVNIDFANIGNAWFEEFFSRSAIIKDLTIGDTTVTGELVGVTIKGDLIEGGTVKADKLVVKGTDGIYYKLNYEAGKIPTGEPVPDDSLHGSVITAESITAEKVSVKDLVAFGATIGGFHITDRSLYSGDKSTVDNSTRGIYFDTDAQFVVGDTNNYLRYIQVPRARANISGNSIVVEEIGDSINVATAMTDGIFHLSSIVKPSVAASQVIDGICRVYNNIYKLEISAESIVFGDGSRSSAADLKKLTEHVKVGYFTETSMCEVIFNATSGEYTRGEVVIKNIIAQTITATPVDGVSTTSGDQVYYGDGTDYAYICFVQDIKPCVELAEGDSDFKQVITNTKTQFMDGAVPKTTIDKDGITTDNLTVNNEFRQGGFVWASRPNGNYGLSWVKGVTS